MLTGNVLRKAIISGAANIINHKSEVDELNVYPVPDGDTGTNMSLTMTAALKQLQNLDENTPVSKVADITASALLRGARGNSGVITSLLFRGFAKGLSGLSTATTEDLTRALDYGVKAAYKAVMQPTEGTILTVARLASIKAKHIYKHNTDIPSFWQEVLAEAETALENTPNLLPQLKKAGVVDAGGKGLCLIWLGMLEIFKGNKGFSPLDNTHTKDVKTAVADFQQEITFTYCTEFLVNKNPKANANTLRAYLESIGDCVVTVDDDDIIKVHVHTNHPGNAIEKALTHGTLTSMKIENMREQHTTKIKEAATIRQNNIKPAEVKKQFGFVAVCAGRGIANLFKDSGIDIIVSGGQTMNPSTDDILNAVHQVPAETVFILPNNKNIIMAAEQVVPLTDRKVCVIPTRNIPQGLAAIMNFDETLSLNENSLNMTKATESISSGSLTYAARDSELDGKTIKKGEILALDNGRLSFTGKDLTKSAYKLTRRLIRGDSSFVTLIYGSDVTDENAEYLKQALEKKYNGRIEFLLINGSQPVYYYFVSVE
ncbi:MAG: DAK2 domain-containing protein [Oscillospiraceae bacterium]|jgi:DAK2 domain fusion protein YloV|nr:DAK2 domain-containing protein [Oscillospiraceae bacterium]